MQRLSKQDIPSLRHTMMLVMVSFMVAYFSCVDAFAYQQNAEPAPCTVGFVGKPSAIMSSSFIKDGGFMPANRENPESYLMTDAVAVRGVLSLPEEFSEFAHSGPASGDFYIEFTLKTDAQDSRYFQYVEKRGERTGEQGKAVVYQVSGNPDFQAIFDGKKIVLASLGFEYFPKDLPNMTDRLEKMLDEDSQVEGLIAFDAKSARPFLESAVQFGAENLPPMAKPYLEMLQRIEGVVVSMEMDEIAHMKARVECERSADAKELARMVDELVDLAKENSQGPGLNNAMAIKILNTVKSRPNGSDVEISMEINEDAIKQSKLASVEMTQMNNQRQSALSFHNFFSANNRLPFLAGEGESDQLSWRVRVLPYLDQAELFERFDLSQPWDSPQNRKALQEMPMPRVFGDSGNETNLRWIKSDVKSLTDITRGTSNTICFVHSNKAVPWTENNDMTPEDVIAQFKALKPGESLIASFYDGSVRKIAAETDLEEFSAMLRPRHDE